MGFCELCGKESNNIVKTKVVGSIMNTCLSCSSKGEIIEEKKELSKVFKYKKKDIISYEIIENYNSIINSAISKNNLDIHKLARGVNIKESILSKMLLGKISMDINTARKLENYLNIKLVKLEESSKSQEEILEELKFDDEKSLSLGDLLLKELNKKQKKS